MANTNYDFNDILASLRGGAKLDDLMAEFTKQVNAAVETYDRENKVLDRAYAGLAEAWNEVAIAYIDKHGIPEGYTDIDDMLMDTEEAEKLFESIVGLGAMLQSIKNAFSDIKPAAKPTNKGNDIEDIFNKFFKENGI